MISEGELALLRNAMDEFAGHARLAIQSVLSVRWFGRFVTCIIYDLANTYQDPNSLDTDWIREFAVHVFYYRFRRKYGLTFSDVSIQETKVVVDESVRAAYSVATGNSSAVSSAGALHAGGGQYLGINVPDPNGGRYWVTRCDDYEESLCQLTGRERQVLYLLWSAKGKLVRTDILCDKVYRVDDEDDFRPYRNRLNGVIHKLKKKLFDFGIAIVYSSDSDGYVLSSSSGDAV